MKERLQLSLRFDDKRELLDEVKLRAAQLGITLKEFVVLALENALQGGLTPQTRQSQGSDKTEALEAKISALDIRLVEVERALGE